MSDGYTEYRSTFAAKKHRYGSVYDSGITHCVWPGCKEPFVPSDGSGKVQHLLCAKHLRMKRSRSNGDDGSTGAFKPHLTPEQETEVRRRMRNFEDPKTIARDLGVAKSTVMRVMKR